MALLNQGLLASQCPVIAICALGQVPTLARGDLPHQD
jgi:hypothetical protein